MIMKKGLEITRLHIYIYIYIYIYIVIHRQIFRCITTLQCSLTSSMLQARIETHLMDSQLNILHQSNRAYAFESE